jgi:hypothetical protein
MKYDVDLCLTIGRRPTLLRQTLESLLPRANFKKIIAINDFRDEETNDVFKNLCPAGILINLDEQIGHHRAVDLMYSKVNSPYILHCEDDWLFNSDLMLSESIQLLQGNKKIGSVCLRTIEDYNLSIKDKSNAIVHELNDIKFCRLDGLHEQWHGYTFNPHVTSLSQWKEFGPYSAFKKERHLSRKLRSAGTFVAYLQPGSCVHIGVDDSVSNPIKKSKFNFRELFNKLGIS